MLEHEKTLELISLSQQGDQDAKAMLIEHNTPLIKSIVRRYKGKHIEYDDLMQLGALGLIKAINNFDPSFSVKFSTYAVPMIMGEIKRFIRDDGAVKVSRALKTLSCKITGFIEEYSQEHQHEPGVREIAEKFDIDENEVVYVLDSAKFPVSLYEKSDEENGKNLIDRLADKTTQEEIIDKLLLKEAITQLPEREKSIIMMRYYDDKTQSEIASIMGVSQVQISRLEAKIIGKLKKAITG